MSNDFDAEVNTMKTWAQEALSKGATLSELHRQLDTAYDEAMSPEHIAQREANIKAEQEHRENYPLCSRWSDHMGEAVAIIDFLNWLTKQYPSEYSEEGHNFEIAAWGNYKTRSIAKDMHHLDRFAVVLENIADGGERLITVNVSVEDLVYAYFGIDTRKLETERSGMLEKWKKMNSKSKEPA